MDKPLTIVVSEKEANLLEIIRKLEYGQIVVHLEAHKITHVERKESIKV